MQSHKLCSQSNLEGVNVETPVRPNLQTLCCSELVILQRWCWRGPVSCGKQTFVVIKSFLGLVMKPCSTTSNPNFLSIWETCCQIELNWWLRCGSASVVTPCLNVMTLWSLLLKRHWWTSTLGWGSSIQTVRSCLTSSWWPTITLKSEFASSTALITTVHCTLSQTFLTVFRLWCFSHSSGNSSEDDQL